MSPSSRRAWIEIRTACIFSTNSEVALLAEGVDRNRHEEAGGVRSDVALLAEGVDRNTSPTLPRRIVGRSPSSRRAWIEIVFLIRLITS